MALSAAIPTIIAGVQAAGSLGNLFSQNRFQKRQLAQQERQWEEQMRDWEEQRKERAEEKIRLMNAQKVQDLFNNATWAGDKNQERIQQNYGYYLRNLMGRG